MLCYSCTAVDVRVLLNLKLSANLSYIRRRRMMGILFIHKVGLLKIEITILQTILFEFENKMHLFGISANSL